MKKLSTRIWAIIVAFLAITILFMYVLTNFLYEGLYVKDVENSMVEIGGKLSTMYDGGKVTDDFINKINQYNSYSNVNVFAVRNPRELSACVPFDIDYDTLIGSDERAQLLEGKTITKKGYEKRFDRQVISAIIPLTDQNRLEGIIYIYFPLAKITEMASKEVFILLGSALIFIFLIGFGVYKGIKHIMKPLKELQNAAEKMSVGDYETRVEVNSKDEIGHLAQTFNKMAASIQQEDEAQKKFLTTVSHELRTPISYVKGYGEALEHGYIEESQRQQTLALIVREANRLEKLTNELLQLSRAVDQQDSKTLYPLPLAETIREVVHITQQQMHQKAITLRTDIDEEIIISADEEKIQQILINLIENALRYSEEKTEMILSAKKEGDFAVITVQDHGIGIPKEDLPHIAERFYRVNKARSRSDGGSGLGLSIVDQLVKYHKGNWQIDSELGKGTTVKIQIPLIGEF
ncbi:sensor histidine kinase [Rummeliibacillus pycnus]|uniref:sensor histidine kinase n=1 Tax=Rummeliibacillus pycnus TaxID=101070 RepID=UPI003D2CA4C9